MHAFLNHVSVCTLWSASEFRRGLEAERVMPNPDSAGRAGSWLDSDSPADPRVTELPAFLRDVLQEPGASVEVGLLGSCPRKKRITIFTINNQLYYLFIILYYYYYLFYSSTCWQRGRKQPCGITLVVQVVDDLSVFSFLCKWPKSTFNIALVKS